MIFCLEDDISIRELMIYTLKSAGFEAEGFENSASFWSRMKETIPELILLDVMLPDEDGITVLKKLRKSPVTDDIPVIMATAKGSEYDKIVGLDSGADDYLVKPFGMMEMVSRIKAVLRRSGRKNTALLSMGNIILNERDHIVKVDDRITELTLKEYELLKLFISNPGRAFTRDNLLVTIWGVDFVGETRTVDVHIGTLRTKLGNSGYYIKTVRGVGYKMEEAL